MSDFAGSVTRGALFMRIDCSPAIRLWVGFGEIKVPINDIDADEEIYQGLGAITGLPELQQLLNGVAGRGQFNLSGISQTIAALAGADFAAVKGKALNIGLSEMDADWQLVAPPLWLWDGTADTLDINLQGGGDGSQAYALSLGAGTATTGRSRPDYATWTDAQQQRAHPGDLFLNHTPVQEKTKVWPGG